VKSKLCRLSLRERICPRSAGRLSGPSHRLDSIAGPLYRRWAFVVLGLFCLRAGVAAADERGSDGGAGWALYQASDFPLPDAGVDPGFDGAATLWVWASTTEHWQFTNNDGVLALRFEKKPGDPLPRWQSLGKINVTKGRSLRIKIGDGSSSSSPTATKPSSSETKKQSDAKTSAPRSPEPLLPAYLLLTSRDESSEPAVLDLIRGNLDSVQPPRDDRRTHVRTNYQGVDFQAPVSLAAWRDRAHHLREQMRVTLGLWPAFPKTPLNPRIDGKLDRDDYTIEKVVLETLPGFTLSGNLYRPAQQCDKAPAILCPHGHWEDGRMNPEVQARCIRWAKLGCVVFMYDMVGYNDSKPFKHAFLNDRLRRFGLSLATLHTWNSIRALDWLTSLPDVDPARIGCTGESGGGTQTFLLTALDDRIKVSAPVVMVSDTFQGGCVCENAAGLRHGTDNVEFAALCAPRPQKLVGASGDWTAKTMTRAFPAIRGVYSLFGATDRVAAEVFDFPHNYNQTSRNAVYAFMAHWLLGTLDTATTREGEQQPEKPDDLATFNKEYPAPAGSKTPEQLEADLVSTLEHMIDDLAPSASSPARWQAARGLLLTALETRVGVRAPVAEDLGSQEVRRSVRDGVTVVQATVSRKSSGEAIPVVRLVPAHPSGRVTVVAHPRGKAGLAMASGAPAPLVTSLLSHGQSVVGFDPLFVGESFDSSHPVHGRPSTAHFETYNPMLAADQMQDLVTVLAWVRSQPDVREVSLVALDLAGPQALLARPALRGVARTFIELKDLPDPKTSGALPGSIDLAGMYQFGGFKAAAALAAPAPLWISSASPAFDQAWVRSAYALADAAHVLRLEPPEPSAEEIAEWIDGGE
jgi:Acetyl xylan esterase (AXE1)